MAIEPLGSMMSLQAQNSVKIKPVEKNVEMPDVAVQPPQAIDKTTAVVDPAQSKGKGQENQTEQGKEQANAEQIRKAVEQMNKKMEHAEAVFGIHEETKRVTIKIVDKDTKEIIKELPPEKTLDMIAKVWEMAGILVDEKR